MSAPIEFHDGDRVMVRGTVGPVYTVVGQQRGQWVGLRADGSTRESVVEKDGHVSSSGADIAVRVATLDRVSA